MRYAQRLGLLLWPLTILGLGLLWTAAAEAQSIQAQFATWLQEFRVRALGEGISAETFDREMSAVRPNLRLPDLDLPAKAQRSRNAPGQAEFTKPPQAYLNARYLAQLAKRGQQLARKHSQVLAEIEQRIGVPAPVVLAIWGRETSYGRAKLRHNAIDVLATQAFVGRRREMFAHELIAALRIIDQGIAPRSKLRSSWAGALGLTQFMPTEVFSTAYDLDGDGRKDIWSVPDALASAANQLKQKGWLDDRPWGVEVKIGGRADCAMAGPQNTKTIGDWERLGVRHVSARAFTAAERSWPAYLLVAGGTYGPTLLVTENYVVFRRYNLSDLYALFVGDLANRIAGRGTFDTPWADLKQVTTGQLAEIQERLKALGFGISKIDGKLGSNTRSQIGLYQRSAGTTPDCWPTRELLAELRSKP